MRLGRTVGQRDGGSDRRAAAQAHAQVVASGNWRAWRDGGRYAAPRYEGRLVGLRAPEPEDIELYYRWMNDPEVTEGLAARYPFSRATEREWVESNAKPSYDTAHYAIVVRDTGELIGGCGFHLTSAENRSAELGISIGDKSRWHQGYGTDAMRTLCRFGFDEMGLLRGELRLA